MIIPTQIDGETYYTAREAARYLHISHETFYQNVKDKLRAYKQGTLSRKLYRKSELDKFKEIRPADQER